MGLVRNKKILVIPDVHFPFHDKSIVRQILEAIKREKPAFIVQVGDLYDFFAQSSFPKSLTHTPKDEVEAGQRAAEEMWRIARKYAPKAKCFQLLGNHDVRPAKRLLERSPELRPFLDMKTIFEFEGVETIHDTRDELEIDGILFTHGHLSHADSHLKYYGQSVVRGHSHMGGVVFQNGRRGPLFELSCGYAADPHSVPLRYTQTKAVRWCHGYGLIDEKGPRFVPLFSTFRKK